MLTAAQKQERKSGIGGSDAAAIVGCHAYKTARELYHEKRGEVAEEDIGDQDAVHWGNVLEDVVAAEYARRTGHQVARVNRTLRRADYPFILAHIDRNVLNTDRALECKTAGAFASPDDWGPTGSDQVPESYLIQCQHYMAVLPCVAVFDLAVLIGGQDFRIYEIPRDQEIIDGLVGLEVEFWANVQSANAPDFEFNHKSTPDLLCRLYPGTDGSVQVLDEESVTAHDGLVKAKQQIKLYQGIAEEHKTRLLALCGSAAVSLLPDLSGGGYSRKEIQRKGYTVDPKSYIDFRFSKAPKGTR